MKNTDDMSMEDILASIRKYVSSNSEPSKYDKKLVPSSQASNKSNAKVIPLKEEAEEVEEEMLVKKPIMFEKALSKAKFSKKVFEENEKEDVSSSSGREINLMKFIRRSIDEKIQNWIDQNLEALVEKHLSIALEKVAAEQLSHLFKEED